MINRILFLIVIISFVLFGCLRGDKTVILVPEKLKHALIVFNCPCGEDPVWNDQDEIVYKIPDNGVLIMKTDRPRGVVKLKVFKIDSLGRRNLVFREAPGYKDDYEKDSTFNYYMGNVGFNKATFCYPSDPQFMIDFMAITFVGQQGNEKTIDSMLFNRISIR